MGSTKVLIIIFEQKLNRLIYLFKICLFPLYMVTIIISKVIKATNAYLRWEKFMYWLSCVLIYTGSGFSR